jgi:hypothetical protein
MFWWRLQWGILSSGIWCHVAHVETDVSEEHIASILRIKTFWVLSFPPWWIHRPCELGLKAFSPRRWNRYVPLYRRLLHEPHGVISRRQHSLITYLINAMDASLTTACPGIDLVRVSIFLQTCIFITDTSTVTPRSYLRKILLRNTTTVLLYLIRNEFIVNLNDVETDWSLTMVSCSLGGVMFITLY